MEADLSAQQRGEASSSAQVLGGPLGADELVAQFGAPRYLIVKDDELAVGKQELRIGGVIDIVQVRQCKGAYIIGEFQSKKQKR